VYLIFISVLGVQLVNMFRLVIEVFERLPPNEKTEWRKVKLTMHVMVLAYYVSIIELDHGCLVLLNKDSNSSL